VVITAVNAAIADGAVMGLRRLYYFAGWTDRVEAEISV
jgi:hypothetical protein